MLSQDVEIIFQAHVEPPLRTRRIAIIGFAESCWPPESVWADPTIEKWTLNHGHGIDPRWDRLFEFHSREVIDGESKLHFRGVDQWQILQDERKRPIYMKDIVPEIPRSVRFQIDDFKKFYGARCEKLWRKPYVEMAAGYMLGYAIMLLTDRERYPAIERPCDIYVYGFELFDGEEYAHQRANFEFYAGYALGAGITLHVPDQSAVFATRGLYEYETGEAAHLLNQADKFLAERFAEMKKKFAEAGERQATAVAEMQTISGIMQEVEQYQKFVRHLLRGGNYD